MLSPSVSVLRLGHRVSRDKRITTHCALVARAFGAERILLSGERDESVLKSVSSLVNEWGGSFSCSYEPSPLKFCRDFKSSGGTIVHLTFYGLPLSKCLPKIRSSKKILAVIGAEKVPFSFYELADFNVSVTSQPHSEVAALSVFLDRLYSSKELSLDFSEAKRRIIPSAMGKKFHPSIRSH